MESTRGNVKRRVSGGETSKGVKKRRVYHEEKEEKCEASMSGMW